MRRAGQALGGPKRLVSVLSLALIILTHHQAAAQVTAPAPAAATGTQAVTGATPAAAAAAPAAGAGVDAAKTASPWQAMSDSLAKVMAETLGSRPGNVSAADMIQNAAEMLRGVGTGKNVESLLSGAGAPGTFRASGMAQQATNSDLLNAFETLRSTARRLGLALPANSPTLDTWTRVADALRSAGGRDLTAVFPALVGGAAAGAGAGTAADMGQTAQPFDFPVTPADFRVALATLANLGLDAFLNGPGAVISLTSLLLGLVANIMIIVASALYTGGASVALGAGIDSLDPNKLQKFRDSSYVNQFAELAREAETSVLPASLNGRTVQTVDWALQVLQRTISIAEMQQHRQQRG